jgi:hypothetical protein
MQAKASDTASSTPYSFATGSAASQRSTAQIKRRSKAAAAAAALRPRRTRSSVANIPSKAAAPKEQQQQQQGLNNYNYHHDKLVPAPFQGRRGDLIFDGELRCVQQNIDHAHSAHNLAE